jgi:manganese/zinc/iron transport system substrate-binding protein
MYKVLAFFGIIAVLLLASCSGQAAQPSANSAESGGDKLNVVATTGQIADTIQNIAGDAIELTTLLGPGIDPHTYVAAEGDITTLQNANVIFYNGLHLEAQMERVLEQIGQSGDITVVAVADQLDPLTLLNWEPEAGLPHDPHVWNDVRLWTQVSYVIRDTLVEADPDNAATYEANATAYARELDELHNYMLEQVEQIPQERRVLVTAHDAFGYFGRAYGLAVEAIQGISTQSEASTADIQAMADVVVQRQVPAIFVETTISPRTIEAVKEAVQAQGQEVTVGGTLFSDAMGEPNTPEGTYIGMMRYNIDTIVAALAQ